MKSNRWPASSIALAVAAAFPLAAHAAGDDTAALRQEVDQLRKEVSELRALVKSQVQSAATRAEVMAVQSDVKAVQADVTAVQDEVTRVATESVRPADTNSKAVLTGSAAVGYTDMRGSNSSFSMAEFNPIFLYQYKDLLLFRAQLATGVDADGGTEVALEYANANLFVNDTLTLYAGKFLSPAGYFFQNLHPPWINRLPSRPPGFGNEGSAAPEAFVGLGGLGGFALGETARANYSLYVGNSPLLELNEDGNEIEAIEAEGNTLSANGGKVVGGRIGVLPIPGLELGVSGGTGRVAIPGESTRSYSLLGADASYMRGGLGLHAEYIQQGVGALSSSVAPEARTWRTWYAQLAYRIPSTKWEPVVRYGDYKGPYEEQQLKQWALGLDYWFTSSAVGKIAYEFNKGLAGTPNDVDRFLLQFGYGS